MLYATYGWAATTKYYDIEFWDSIAKTTVVVASDITQNRYTYAAPDTAVGLLIVYPKTAEGHRSKPYTFPINGVPSLSNLRWQARASLNDTETAENVDMKYPETPKWPDTELDSYAREAIRFYGSFIAKEFSFQVRQENIDKATFRDVREIYTVSFRNDQTQQRWEELVQASRRGRHPYQSRNWDFFDGTFQLYKTFPESTEFLIEARGSYNVPITDYQPIDIPLEDWDILLLAIEARAYIRLAGQSAQLDRWKEEGKRNDNPVTPIARMLLTTAEERLKDRRPPRVIRRVRGG